MILFSTLKKVLFWSYERGSWQYDLLCALILAFIFLSPNELFRSNPSVKVYVIKRELVGDASGDLEQKVAEQLSQMRGRKVYISRIEPIRDDYGNLTGYIVWEK
jgi:hypothetical protein